MLMLGLSETMHQLAMVSSVRWYGHVLRKGDGHVLRRALWIEVEGERKKWRLKRTWKRLVEEEIIGALYSVRVVLDVVPSRGEILRFNELFRRSVGEG